MIAGGMAEWSMAVVLKTTKVQAFGGSNPSPSARALFRSSIDPARLKRNAAGPSGPCLIGDLPLLEDPDGVAEGVADAHVGAVEVVGGLLGEVGDAARLEGLVQTPDVVRLEHAPAQRALRDQLAELRSGGVVMHRRARLLQGDLGDVARDAHRQPAVGTLLDVLALLQPELVDVEVKSLVLVEDHDRGDVEFGDHRSFSPLRDLMGMTLMLGGRRCGGVSKTARSPRPPRRHHRPRGRQLEAVGRHHRLMPHAVVGRRLADDLPEHADEGASAAEADVEADVGDAAVRLAQQEHRALYPPPLQVTVRRLPEDGSEAANEVGVGDVSHRGHGADVERLGVGAVHGVAGAQQAPVQVLDFPAHAATLRHWRARAQPPSVNNPPYRLDACGRDRLAFQASGSWVATGGTAGSSTYKLSRCSHVVLYGGLGQGFLDHRAAAAAPYGLGGSEDQTSR